MTDFWEILGRMLTDAKVKDGILNAFPPGDLQMQLNKTGQGAIFNASDQSVGAWTRSAAYAKLRNKTDPHLRMRRTSLMTLGELLRLMTLPTGDTARIVNAINVLADRINQFLDKSQHPSSSFCTLLGAMVLDAQLRDQIKGDNAKNFIDDLGSAEIRTLNQLAFDDEFIRLSDAVCSSKSGWDAGCNVRSIFYDQHVYPLPQEV